MSGDAGVQEGDEVIRDSRFEIPEGNIEVTPCVRRGRPCIKALLERVKPRGLESLIC